MSYIRRIIKGDAVYLAEVKSVRRGKKVVQEFIRYVGKEVNGRQILSSSISNLTIDSVKVYGPLAVLHSLAVSVNLNECMGEYSKEILSLVYAHCIQPQSISSISEWYAKTDLNYILGLASVTEERLLRAIDSLEKCNRDVLQEIIFDNVKKAYPLGKKGLFYDVTNTYLYGKCCPLGKRGHSKEGRDNNPLVQIGLGILRESGIPVFHSVYEGNVHDARIFSDAIERFSSFDISDFVVIYDRGITSENNVFSLKKRGLHGICGVPIRASIKKIVRKMAASHTLVSIKKRVQLVSTKMYVADVPYTIGGVRGKLLICFNPKMKDNIRENRYDEIMHAKENIKLRKNVKPGILKYFDVKGTINEAVLSKAEEMDGYSCIFSTDKNITNETIVRTYFEKDLVEKTFHTLKGIVRLRPIRHWLKNRVVGHIFICFLSYLLLSLLRYRLIRAGLSYSPSEALKKLETYYKIYARDAEKGFTIEKTVALTKEQEQIIRAVDKKLGKM